MGAARWRVLTAVAAVWTLSEAEEAEECESKPGGCRCFYDALAAISPLGIFFVFLFI